MRGADGEHAGDQRRIFFQDRDGGENSAWGRLAPAAGTFRDQSRFLTLNGNDRGSRGDLRPERARNRSKAHETGFSEIEIPENPNSPTGFAWRRAGEQPFSDGAAAGDPCDYRVFSRKTPHADGGFPKAGIGRGRWAAGRVAGATSMGRQVGGAGGPCAGPAPVTARHRLTGPWGDASSRAPHGSDHRRPL